LKVIIAAGGPGGHHYPGIGIAREILSEAENEVLFVGTQQGIEGKVLPKEDLTVRFVPAGRLKGMSIGSVLKTFITLPLSLIASANLLRQERPHAVVGVGGYASGPVALAAWLLRIPLVIVEPNSYAGLANRLAGRFAAKIFVCFPGRDAQGFFPEKKKVLTGPLVRKSITSGDRDRALKAFGLESGRFTLFVMGGSGGAHAINMSMKDAAPELRSVENLQVLHQTGEKDVEEVKAGYQAAGVKAAVLPYINDMPGAYAAADLVVSRSGATTVAELAVCGKRAVLIPYPFAADNHQEYNARSLAKRGGGEVIVQKDLTPAKLAAVIQRFARDRDGAMSPLTSNAAQEIVRACKAYVQKD